MSGARTKRPFFNMTRMSALALDVIGLAFRGLAGVNLTQAQRSLVGLHIIR
jgi:hypothetical protein